MKLLAESDSFAVTPYYYLPGSDIHGDTISSVIESAAFGKLDSVGVSQYLNKAPDGTRTCFQGISKLPPNQRLLLVNGELTTEKLPPIRLPSHNLRNLLVQALIEATAGYSRYGLALSGGLDSALVLSLLREAGVENIEVYTLATGMQGYCELEISKQTAKYFGVKLNIIHATDKDFINALPEVITSIETPIYNLHPVSKLLLARAMKADGIDCIITGDAADQAFSGSPAANYLPLVGAIMRDQEIGYVSPFFDKYVVAYGESVSDENKTTLRKLSSSLVPTFLQSQEKQPRFAPDFNISRYWNPQNINLISDHLNMTPDIQTEASRTLWTTLGMLSQNLLRDKICAA